MDETIFKTALAAVSSGEYSDYDVKILKEHLKFLNQKELSLKRQMEKTKNEFVKNKDKSCSELKTIRGDIKQLQNILKTV